MMISMGAPGWLWWASRSVLSSGNLCTQGRIGGVGHEEQSIESSCGNGQLPAEAQHGNWQGVLPCEFVGLATAQAESSGCDFNRDGLTCGARFAIEFQGCRLSHRFSSVCLVGGSRTTTCTEVIGCAGIPEWSKRWSITYRGNASP